MASTTIGQMPILSYIRKEKDSVLQREKKRGESERDNELMQSMRKGSCKGPGKVTQTNVCLAARCWRYCYRLFSKVDDNLRRGVRGA